MGISTFYYIPLERSSEALENVSSNFYSQGFSNKFWLMALGKLYNYDRISEFLTLN